MAGKPLEEGVKSSGSWLESQLFSAGARRAKRASTQIKTTQQACVLIQMRAAARDAAGDGKITVLVPKFRYNFVLTPEHKLFMHLSPAE